MQNSIYTTLIVIFLTILTFNLFSIQGEEKFTNPVDSMNTSSISGASRPLLIKQVATISRTYYPLNLPTNASFVLVKDWVSRNTTVYFEGITYNKDRVSNGNFNYGESPWVFKSSTSNFARTSPSGNYVSMRITRSINFVKNQYGFFEENVSVAESLTPGRLAVYSVDYYFNRASYYPSSNMSIYLSVTMGGISKNLTVKLTELVFDSWTKLTLTYDPVDIGQSLPGTITLRAGVWVMNASRSPSEDQYVYFDNVKFTIWTGMNQQNVLIVKDTQFNQNYSYQNTTYGRGMVFINVQRSRSISSDVIFTIYKNSAFTDDIKIGNITIKSSVDMGFNSTINSNQGSSFVSDGIIKWKTEWYFTTPADYFNDRVEIEKPADWNVKTISDGHGINQSLHCTGLGLGSIRSIIPKAYLSDGMWKLEAESSNYITNSFIQVWNGFAFENKTNLHVGNSFRVGIVISSSVSLAGSLVECRISYPNSSRYIDQSILPPSSTVFFGNFSVTAGIPVGFYHVQVNWTNNINPSKKDKIGIKELDFEVIHDTNLTAIYSMLECVRGEPLLVKIKLMDLDINSTVQFASVSFNTSYGFSGGMSYLGSGVYMAELDTASVAFGDHFISVNASKAGYRDCYANNLIHLKITPEYLKVDVPREIKSVFANSYAFYRINVTGAVSRLFLHPVNLTTDWSQNYTILDYGNGSYGLNFSTYDSTTSSIPETFTIKIYASKTDYASTFDAVILTVYPIPASVGINSTFVEVHAGDQFFTAVNYTADADGSLIPNASISITWLSDYQVAHIGNAIFITFNTTGMNTNTYIGIIQASRAGYETVIVSFFAVVKPVQSELILLNPEPIEFVRGGLANLSCRFLARGVDFLNGTINLMGDLTGIFQRSGPIYYFTINTSLLTQRMYFVQIYAYGPNIESTVKDVIFSVVPIHATGHLNMSLIEVSLTDRFQIEASYCVLTNGDFISGANISITWPSNYSVFPLSDKYLIRLETGSLSPGTFTGVVRMEHPSYDVILMNFQVIIKPIDSTLIIENDAPYEFVKGDIVNIQCKYLAGPSDLLGASINITGDLTGAFDWNGTCYVFSINASAFSPKIYFAQIIAAKANAETQLKDFIFKIVPLKLEINLVSPMIHYVNDADNMIMAWVYDASHSINRTDLEMMCSINGKSSSFSLRPDGMYELSINEYSLEPSSTPYLATIRVSNPNGDDAVEIASVVVAPPEPVNYLITIAIFGVPIGILVAVISSYNSKLRLTRFQQEVKLVKNHLEKRKRMEKYKGITREATIDQLLEKDLSGIKVSKNGRSYQDIVQ